MVFNYSISNYEWWIKLSLIHILPQNYDDVLNNYEYVLDFIAPSNYKDDITRARMYLGNMKFTREEMTGKIKDLSNGTKAKLFLMKLVLDKCNVLILDEPTRNCLLYTSIWNIIY